jgi:hypothetical protein
MSKEHGVLVSASKRRHFLVNSKDCTYQCMLVVSCFLFAVIAVSVVVFSVFVVVVAVFVVFVVGVAAAAKMR